MGTEVENKLVTGIYLITSKYKDKENGMIAAWVTRLSFKPRLVGIAIGKVRYSHNIIKESRKFVINFLSKEDNETKEIIDWFGKLSGRDINKMKRYKWMYGKIRVPILKKAFAYLECEVIDERQVGDHTIFIGRIIDGKLVDKNKNSITTLGYE